MMTPLPLLVAPPVGTVVGTGDATLESLAPTLESLAATFEALAPTLEPLAPSVPAMPLPGQRASLRRVAVPPEPPPLALPPPASPLQSLPAPFHPPGMVPPRPAVLEPLGPGLVEGIGGVGLSRGCGRGEKAHGHEGEQPNPADHRDSPAAPAARLDARMMGG